MNNLLEQYISILEYCKQENFDQKHFDMLMKNFDYFYKKSDYKIQGEYHHALSEMEF